MIVNQGIPTMFDINTFIYMVRIVPFWDQDKDPRSTLGTHYFYLSCPSCDGDYLCLICILSHRFTMYWAVAMFMLWHNSTIYFLWLWSGWVMKVWIHNVLSVAIPLVSTIMDPQCTSQWPWLESIYTEHGYAYLRMIYTHICILDDVCL